MAVKKSINDSLSRVTGYQITRAQRGGVSLSERQVRTLSTSSRALATTATSLAATVRQLQAELRAVRAGTAPASPAPAQSTAAQPTPAQPAAAQPALAQPAAADTFPRDYDAGTVEIIRAVRPYSLTGNDQLHALISATKYVSRYDVPGAIVEFGVWRGGNMKAVTLALAAADNVSRDLYLYDTFEGAPGSTAVASLADVQERFATGGYPQEKIHLVSGPVREAVPDQLPEQIAILRLDADSGEFTDDQFKHAYDRLVSGGVLMIDGYGWAGSPAAELLEGSAEKLLLLRAGSGRLAVKP